MLRTTGLESDARGSRTSLVWEAFEIDMAAQTIAALASLTSAAIYTEGFQHFHVYVTRSDPNVVLDVHVVPVLPIIQAAVPQRVGQFNVGTMGVGLPAHGVFYFGAELGLTDARGATFRFGPIIELRVANTDPANPVTVDVHLHCSD